MRMKKYLLKNDPIQTGKKKSKSIKSQGVYNIMKTSLTPWGLWLGWGVVWLITFGDKRKKGEGHERKKKKEKK